MRSKLGKASVSFVASVCLHVSALLPLDGYPWIWYWGLLWKSVENPQIWLKSENMPGSLHEDLSTFYWYRRHKFAIKELLCKTQYCCGFDSDVHCLNNASFLTKRYSLYKVLACSATFFHLSLFCATFFQFPIFMLFISSKTSSFQRGLGLPIGLLDMDFHLLIFCTILSPAMRSTWPNQFNICFF